MFKRIVSEIDSVFARDPAARSRLEIVLCYPGLHAILFYRLSHWLWTCGFKLPSRLLSSVARFLTGIEIHPGAVIGQRLFIDHGMGVVIGETAEIGDDCTIYQGVTLGALSFPTDEDGQLVRGQKRHPTLEDGVVVYANATILGGRTVVGRRDVPARARRVAACAGGRSGAAGAGGRTGAAVTARPSGVGAS